MANKRIKGITIELDGETTGLNKALSDVNKKATNLSTELKDVERALKFNPGNTELIAQQQQLLAKEVENSTEKLNRLKTVQSQVEQQFQSGDLGEEQYRAFQREIIKTESQLNGFKQKLENVDDGKSLDKVEKDIKDVTNESKRAEKAIDGMGNSLKTATKGAAALGAAGIAALGGLVAGTDEYNSSIARLNANASNAGFDPKFAEEQANIIASLTGEMDSAVETVSNLMATDMDQNQLAEALEHINGAAIKFSDTLKTEGIADGLQETLATGAAIGPFAELLERSGVDLEKFNEGLTQAQKNGNETNYVLQQLSDLGLSSNLEAYKELNPELTAQKEAQQELNKQLAELAIHLTPLLTLITSFLSSVFEWVNGNVELVKSFDTIGEGLQALLPHLAEQGIGIIKTIINSLSQNLPMIYETGFQILVQLLQGIISALPELLAMWQQIVQVQIGFLQEMLPMIIQMGVMILMSLIQGIIEMLPELVTTVVFLVTSIVDMIVASLPMLIEAGLQILDALIAGINQLLPQLVVVAISLVSKLVETLIKNLPMILNAGIKLLSALIDGIVKMFPKLVQQALGLVLGIVQEIIANLDLIIDAAIRIIFALIGGLIQAIPNLVAAVPRIVAAIFNAFSKVKWADIGVNIIKGMISGIKSMLSNLIKALGDVVGGAVNWVKDKLGIHSPSRVFEQFGEYVDQGFINGILSMTNDVAKAGQDLADASIPTLPVFPQPTLKSENNGMGSSSTSELINLLKELIPGPRDNPPLIFQVDGKTFAQITGDYYDAEGGTRIRRIERGLA